jgi:hypothetical protein
MIMECTCDEYRDMLVTIGACDSEAGTAAWKYVLHYLGQCHAGAKFVFMTGAASL